MKELKDLLQGSINKAGIKLQVDSSRIVEASKEIINELIDKEAAGKLEPKYVRNMTLAVFSESSIASSLLKSVENEFILKLNKKFGRTVAKKLKFIS